MDTTRTIANAQTDVTRVHGPTTAQCNLSVGSRRVWDKRCRRRERARNKLATSERCNGQDIRLSLSNLGADLERLTVSRSVETEFFSLPHAQFCGGHLNCGRHQSASS